MLLFTSYLWTVTYLQGIGEQERKENVKEWDSVKIFCGE